MLGAKGGRFTYLSRRISPARPTAGPDRDFRWRASTPSVRCAPMNPSVQGKVYPDGSFTVDPARVAAFREAVGQREGVPPTFATAAELTVFPNVIGDPELGLDFARVVHGSQEYAYSRPLIERE